MRARAHTDILLVFARRNPVPEVLGIRERERERARESKRATEREREREGDREGEREREKGSASNITLKLGNIIKR